MPIIAEKDTRSSSFHYEWHLQYKLGLFTRKQKCGKLLLRTITRYKQGKNTYKHGRHVAAFQLLRFNLQSFRKAKEHDVITFAPVPHASKS